MNPFVYGEKVSGENFCNREQEIKELTSEISSGQNIMIYSPLLSARQVIPLKARKGTGS
jgi:hypothetical protein